jgi:hypothetical protein
MLLTLLQNKVVGPSFIYPISIGNFFNQTPSLMPSIHVRYAVSAKDKTIVDCFLPHHDIREFLIFRK